MKHTVVMHNAQQGREVLGRLWEVCKPWLLAGHKLVVTAKEETRNNAQNALMWVWLGAFSEQLDWPVNGAMVKIEPEEWKDVLSAAYKQETARLAMGLNGGFVLLGLRTSNMGKREMADFLGFMQAEAAMRGVTLPELEMQQ